MPDAHIKEGTITYHLGYIKLIDIAVEKAIEVWPEGKE